MWLRPFALKNADLGVTEPPLVVHLLDGLEDDLCSRLEVRGRHVHLDDDGDDDDDD